MKLTAFFLLVGLLQVSAKGFSQEITLSVRNTSIEKVFQEIKEHTGFHFLYKVADLDGIKPVTIAVTKMPVEKFLELLLKGLPLQFKVRQSNVVISRKQPVADLSSLEEVGLTSRQASEVTALISGKVIDSVGNPLVGASIKIKGTKQNTITNETGVFSVNVSEGDVIVISFVGFNSRSITVTSAMLNSPEFTIILKPTAAKLEEVEVVIHTGYQKAKPNEVNGSVVVIDNKTLNQQTGTNILDRLQNVTNGLSFNPGYSNNNVNNKTNISIRGLSTINGPQDPLIILDNFPYQGDIANINPNDIESVTILKDAAAASIWGARAGNGVIVITTKKGRFKQRPTLSFNAGVIVKGKPDLADLRDMNVSDYIDMDAFLFNKGYFNATINRKYQALTPAVEVLLSRRQGKISAEDSAAQMNAIKAQDSKAQYEDHFYRPAVTQQYSLNVNGGSDYMAWLLASTYDRSIDNLSARYDKVNLRLTNSFKATKNLQFEAGVYYTNSKSTGGKDRYSTVTSVNGRYVPYLHFADDNGQPLAVPRYYRNTYVDTAGAGKLLDWKYYPLDDYRHRQNIIRTDEIVANLGATYKFFNMVQLNILYQYQQQRSASESLEGLGSFETRNTINLFSQLNRSTGEVNYRVPVGDILNLTNSTRNSQNIRAQINFNKQWNDHGIVALVGAEAQEVSVRGNGIRYYGYQKTPLSFVEVDLVNPYPTFITGRNQTISGGGLPSRTVNRFVSVFGNLNYTFKGRYSISASARRDGSNIFGVRTNDKWKPLWSAGIGWDINKEQFFSVSWLSLLKLRATYGTSGNVDLSRTPLPLAGYSLDPITNLRKADVNTLNNPRLQWETVAQANFGLQFSTVNNILSGTIEYYRKYGSNLYGLAPYDYTAWGRQNMITGNVANMEGSGIDVMITSHNVNKSIKWSTTLIYNYSNNKTTKYFDESATSIATLLSGGKSVTPVIGKPLYSIAAFNWGGLDVAGNPQGYLDGVLSTDYSAIVNAAADKEGNQNTLLYIGSSIPTSTGSLINSFSWKNIELTINISYKLGYYFRKPSLSYGGLVGGAMTDKEYAQRWQRPGDEKITNVPSFQYPVNSLRDMVYNYSTVNALKGDHIRLQYINLSYSPVNPLGIKAIQQWQFYFNVANIGVLWKANKSGVDPDFPGIMANPLSIAFGIRTTL